MKAIYNTRMKEYVTELTFISEKLKKYDDILTKKKEKKEKDILSNTDTKY
jgi:kinesin family protein 6/9